MINKYLQKKFCIRINIITFCSVQVMKSKKVFASYFTEYLENLSTILKLYYKHKWADMCTESSIILGMYIKVIFASIYKFVHSVSVE